VVVAVGSLLLLAGALTAGMLSHAALARTLATLAIGLPFILSYWLARRTFYVEGKLPLAAAGAAAYLVLIIAGLYVLKRSGQLSEATAFLVMGATSGVVAVCLGLRQLLAARGSSEPDTGAVFREHVRYARFGLAASALGWVPASIFFLVLPFRHTLGASGELRALVNFTQPALQVFNALATVLVPVFVRLRGSRQFWSLGGRMTALFTAGSVVYWLVIVACGDQLMQLFYHGRYDEVAHLLPIVATLTVVAAPAALLTAMLQALERPDRVMVAWMASAMVAGTLGVILTWRWGVAGAAVGMTLAFLAAGLTMAGAIGRYWATRSRVDERHVQRNGGLDIDLIDAQRGESNVTARRAVGDASGSPGLALQSAVTSEKLR
jgi:O-antigen/teichoic acid export membrane protein